MHSISSQGVIDAFTSYAANHGFAKAAEYHFINIEKVKADAGTQFISFEFKEFCKARGMALSLAAPKK